MQSEWVKSEIGSGWVKQMQTKRIIVLPIYYRQCSIPFFLADRKYADFRHDYQMGFEELASVLGIKETDTLSIDNWRNFARKKGSEWKNFREIEYAKLVTNLVRRAREYNWSAWVGSSKNRYSITLWAFIDQKRKQSVSVRIDGNTYAYMASLVDERNPNNIRIQDFNIYAGNTINECEEFVWRRMEDFKRQFGTPTEKATYFTHRILGDKGRTDFIMKILKELDWDKE